MSTTDTKIDGTAGQDEFVGYRSRRGRRLLTIGIALVASLVTIFVSVYLYDFFVAEDFFESSKVRTAVAEEGRFERSISVEGKVVATFNPTFYAKDLGVISLNVDEGDEVDADQLLATISNAELTSQLRRQQSMLELQRVELDTLKNELKQRELESSQQLTLLKINLEASRRELDRMSQITNKGSISLNDYEKLKDNVHALEVQVENTVQQNALARENRQYEVRTKSLSIDQQALVVDDLKRQVDELSIESPVDGVVGDILVNERDTVVRNQPIMSVVDLSSYEVEVSIPETYAESLEPGIAAYITYRNEEYKGTLGAISPEVKQGSVSARVVFEGDAPAGLRQNLRLNNRIILESKDRVIKVKRGPFVEAHGGRGVYILDGNLARYRRIRVGSVGLNEVEILSGIKRGETLIISNTAELMGVETALITN